jgi:hypothetical protein
MHYLLCLVFLFFPHGQLFVKLKVVYEILWNNVS